MKKTNLTKKNMIMVASAILLLGGGGVAYGANKTKQAKQEESTYLVKQTDGYQELLKQVQALFSDKDEHFLVKDLTDEQIQQVKQTLEKIEKDSKEHTLKYELPEEKKLTSAQKEATALLEQLTEKADMQQALNKCFESVVLNGETVNEKVGIVASLKEETLNSFSTDEKTDDTFKLAVQKLVTNAQGQLKQQAEATKLVNALFDKKEVSAKVTDKAYNEAKKSVDKVLTKTVKERLNKQLTTVKKYLDEKEQAEKEKKEQQERQEQQAQAEQSSQETNVETESWDNTNTNDTTGTVNNGSTGSGSPSTGGGSSSGGSTSNGGGQTGGGSTGSGNTGGSGNAGSGGNTGGSGNGSTGGGSNSGNGGGNTTTPPTEPSQPQEPLGGPGNSGMKFSSMAEAIAWEDSVGNDPSSQWFGMNGHIYPIYYPDGTEAFWTVNFS